MLVALFMLYYFHICFYYLMSCSSSRDIACYVCVCHHTGYDMYVYMMTVRESEYTLYNCVLEREPIVREWSFFNTIAQSVSIAYHKLITRY